MISLILLILKTPTATADTETIICYGKEETYNCIKYNGHNPDLYEYNTNYEKLSSNVHEFNDAGTRNPYAPADNESGRIDENEKTESTPVFIPYNPYFLFSGFGNK
jgi:hypothetical protein